MQKPSLRRHLVLVSVVTLLAFGSDPAGAAVAPEKAFERLSSLSGAWEAKRAGGGGTQISYRLIASDSVLLESWHGASGRESLTVYHLDGSSLLLTHYCLQGNQPRLRLSPSSTDNDLTFEFADATNLAKPTDSHLIRLRLELVAPDRVKLYETYTADGKEDLSVLDLTRRK